MKVTLPVFCLIACVFFGVSKSSAQDQCELTLTQALEEFNAGHFYAVSFLLKECLDNHNNREWRQRAYLLLAETYLLLDDPFGADQSYLQVLKANPEFVTDPARDPIDLVYLSKKFTATPIFTLYGKAGLNTSPIRVIHNVTIGGEHNTREEYELRIGWQAGVGLDWNYNDRIAFSGELNYSRTTFKHQTNNLFAEGEYSVEYFDRQNWINLPLMVKYNHNKGVLLPFAYLGYSVNLLLNNTGIVVVEGDIESPVFDVKNKRQTVNTSFLIGAGLRYKWQLNYFFADLRYGFGLSNVVNPANRVNEINYEWPYVDDDFRIDNVFLSFGYVHPFYKPRKLKKANTRSVLRNLKKK